MNKTHDQIIEERRLRRQVKVNASELESLKEKNPTNKKINDTIRGTGLSVSMELAYCRHLLNELFGDNKPQELVEWNARVEAAKAEAEGEE